MADKPRPTLNAVADAVLSGTPPPSPGRPSARRRGSSSRNLQIADPSRHQSLTRISSQSNMAVAISGGRVRSKRGTLKKKKSQFFASYKTTTMRVDDGKIAFNRGADLDNDSDDDVELETYDLFAVREMRLIDPEGSEFALKLAVNLGDNGSYADSQTKTYVLQAESNEDAKEWLEILKHEISNQVLVIENMARLLSDKNKHARAEPLYVQMVDALRVVHGYGHKAVYDTLLKYATWLDSQDRKDEATAVRASAVESLKDNESPRRGVERRRSRRWSSKLTSKRSTSEDSSSRFSWRNRSGSERSLKGKNDEKPDKDGRVLGSTTSTKSAPVED